MRYQTPEESSQLREDVLECVARWPGSARTTVQRALDHGVSVAGMLPENEQDRDWAGEFCERRQTIYLNLYTLPAEQAFSLVHEAQHVLNAHENRIVSNQQARKRGEDFFVKNELWNEALAQARSFMVAHEAQRKKELREYAFDPMFSTLVYDPTLPEDDALEYYARHALVALKKDDFYMANARANYRRCGKAADDGQVKDTAIPAPSPHQRG